jgi:hypothetical protein
MIVTTTNVTSNVTYLPLEYWYEYYGSSWYQEIAFISFIPSSLVGFILNLLVYTILRDKQFNLPIYSYLRAYTICSACVCLAFSTKFIQNARRIIGVTNSETAIWYTTKFLIPLITILYIYGACLDIVLSLERALLLSNTFKKFKKLNPTKLCVFFFIFSFLFQIPVWFYYEPASKEIPLNETYNLKIHYFTRSEFGNSFTASILIVIHHLIADFLTVFLENLINIITLIYLRKYLKRKDKLMNNKHEKHGEEEAESVFVSDTHVKGEKSKESTPSISLRKKNIKFSQVEVKLTIMVIVLSTLSTM